MNWYYISDSYISQLKKDQLHSTFTYILFYEKKMKVT